MKYTHRLADLFRNAHDGTTWHGKSVTETLQNISAQEAAAHPIPDSHSIWDYVLHIVNWRVYAIRNLREDTPYLVDLNTDLDWTPITDFSKEAWKEALEKFHQSAEELETAIRDMDENQLFEKIVTGSKNSCYMTLHGVIQHDIYHSGQIMLLKKILKTET